MKFEIIVILSLVAVSLSLPIPQVRKSVQIIDLITAKLIQFGYLAKSMRDDIDEIINAIDMYRKFNGLSLDEDDEEDEDFSYQLFDKSKPINYIYMKFKRSSEYILNKLLNHSLRRCSMPDFLRSNRNEMNIKVDLMNGNAYYYITNKHNYEISKELKANRQKKKKLTFTNIKDEFKDQFVKYQIISWWPKTKLKWSFVNKPVDLSFKETLYAFKKSFNTWSSYSNLKFEYVSYDANKTKEIDLLMVFEGANKHDSICKFKFANTTLAHAFYPTQGDAHFELGRSWSLENQRYNNNNSDVDSMKFNLVSVAIHEIGHLIGLGHSSNSKSVMFPDYKMESKNFIFHQDDIEVLNYLYGKSGKKKAIVSKSSNEKKKLKI